MTNAELFKQTFGRYATDVWSLPENEFLEWLNADVQPKIGRWIRFKNFENGYYHIKCSECGQYWSVDGHAKIFKHCFNCGAKMEVKK